ncbi:MAG: cellulase family glycosylhydrolase [Deltaproteobacteria bacterium]|nr:cellulase family glycosylhydrolase [Deltaproteobacteria bacterium]
MPNRRTLVAPVLLASVIFAAMAAQGCSSSKNSQKTENEKATENKTEIDMGDADMKEGPDALDNMDVKDFPDISDLHHADSEEMADGNDLQEKLHDNDGELPEHAGDGEQAIDGDNAAQSGPISIYPGNQKFFLYKGKPIRLFGAYTHAMFIAAPWDSSATRWSLDKWKQFCDMCAQKGINVIRLWINWTGQCYERTGPGNAKDGKPKYDLTKIDNDYLSRLRQWVEYAESRDVILQLILFDAWVTKRDDIYPIHHAFAQGNNINSIAVSGKGFFTMDNQAVIDAQDLYLKKLINAINEYDNWYFETQNEGGSSSWLSDAWVKHVVNFVKTYESTKPKHHLVGHDPNWGGYDPYTHTDIDIYTRILWGTGTEQDEVHTKMLHAYYNGIRPIPFFYDSDGSSRLAPSRQEQLRRNAWAAFMAGGNVNLIWSNGDIPSLFNYLGYLSDFMKQVGWPGMDPVDELTNHGYVLADRGREYILYLPAGGSASFDLSDVQAGHECLARWFDPRKGTFDSGSRVAGGGTATFTAPGGDDWALHINCR